MLHEYGKKAMNETEGNFGADLKKMLQKNLGDEYQVQYGLLRPDNTEQVEVCLAITARNDAKDVFYLNPTKYRKLYEKGSGIWGIAWCIEDDHEHRDRRRNGEVQNFRSWEEIKEGVFLQLMNYERNKLYLQNIPHVRFLDLAFTVRIPWPIAIPDAVGSCILSAPLMEYCDLSEEDLFFAAGMNTFRCNNIFVDTLAHLCSTLTGVELETMERGKSILVVSSKERLFGAAMIGNTSLLTKLAEGMGTDMYILPSSVHELIIMPAFGNDDVSYMKEMVKSVNRNEVAPRDYLSDEVYFYDHAKAKVRLAEEDDGLEIEGGGVA